MNKILKRGSGLALACAVACVHWGLGTALAHAKSEFPDQQQFLHRFANLSEEEQGMVLERKNYKFLVEEADVESGLNHVYQYVFAPMPPMEVVARFIDFKTHAKNVRGIEKAVVRVKPVDPAAPAENLFEVEYELKVLAFHSRYVVQHQIFQDGAGGFGSMWRLSPLTDKLKGGVFSALTKPDDVKGSIWVQPARSASQGEGSVITYYSYQKAKVSRLGVGVGMANSTAKKQLQDTMDDFLALWLKTAAAEADCMSLLKRAPQLTPAGNPSR